MLIRSLRTIIKARAIKEQKKVMVRVMTEDEDKKSEAPEGQAVAEKTENQESVADVVDEKALDDSLI